MWWRIKIYHKNGKIFFVDTNTRRNVADHISIEFRNSFVKKIVIEDSGEPFLLYDILLDKVYPVNVLTKQLTQKENDAVFRMEGNKWWHHTEIDSDLKTMFLLQKRGFVVCAMKYNENVPLEWISKLLQPGASQCFQLTSQSNYYKREKINARNT